jgi:hypothetical protein
MNTPATTPLTFHCADCKRPMILDADTGMVCCQTEWCAAIGMPIPVWRAEQRRTGDPLAGGMPAGLPRPRHDGLPVPWITPVTGDWVWWRLIHGGRVQACQERWLCQVCGLLLPELATVLVHGDRVISDTGLHAACLNIARAFCPAVSTGVAADAYSVVSVDAGDLLADGRPYRPGVRLPERCQWRIRELRRRA